MYCNLQQDVKSGCGGQGADRDHDRKPAGLCDSIYGSARDAPKHNMSFASCRMARADVIARALIGLEGEGLDFVVRAAENTRTEDVTDAYVQVSSALATMDRPDIMADVRSQIGPVLAHKSECTKQYI